MDRCDFNKKIEIFLKKTKMSPTTFGKKAKDEPNFVFKLREGRECREATQQRVLYFIENFESEKGEINE